jgi:hypothetical protein
LYRGAQLRLDSIDLPILLVKLVAIRFEIEGK